MNPKIHMTNNSTMTNEWELTKSRQKSKGKPRNQKIITWRKCHTHKNTHQYYFWNINIFSCSFKHDFETLYTKKWLNRKSQQTLWRWIADVTRVLCWGFLLVHCQLWPSLFPHVVEKYMDRVHRGSLSFSSRKPEKGKNYIWHSETKFKNVILNCFRLLDLTAGHQKWNEGVLY